MELSNLPLAKFSLARHASIAPVAANVLRFDLSCSSSLSPRTAASASGRDIIGRPLMKKLVLLEIVIAAVVLTAVPVSIAPSPRSVVQLSLNTADAQYVAY